jgi:O-antigen ligase
MKLARELSQAEAKKVQTFVLLGGVFTTLAIWTKIEDPINLPKMFVLALSSAIVLGLALPAVIGARKFTTGGQRVGLALIALFSLGLLISTIFTDVKYTAVFGEFHRNNGALTIFACAILTAVSGLAFTEESSLRPLKWVSLLGLFLSVYGVFQLLGQDPVQWNNQYNPIITTLGNPNFTSGIIGISSIASLYFVVESSKTYERVVAAIALVLGLFVVVRSDSVQGIFAFACGAAIILLVKAWAIKRVIGITAGVSLTLVGLPIALAVFNIGPLASRLYQGTLNNRLDYWQAALNMFQSHPLLGVGIDRYGEYYREYAVQDQFVQGVFTNNAHNVYLHLLATGGLILFIPYLLLLAFITFLAIKALKNSNKQNRGVAGTYLGIWLGFLLLNIVTIDNIGVGIWLWIFGGIIIGRSSGLNTANNSLPDLKTNKKKNKVVSDISILPNIASLTLATVMLILCVPLLNNSSKLVELKYNLNSLDQAAYRTELLENAKSNSRNSQTLANLANFAIQKNDLPTALTISKMLGTADPRAFYASFFPAIIYEGTNERNLAIPFRENLLIIDKWNTENMLELVQSYIEMRDVSKATELALNIEKLYPGSENSIKAKALVEALTKP